MIKTISPRLLRRLAMSYIPPAPTLWWELAAFCLRVFLFNVAVRRETKKLLALSFLLPIISAKNYSVCLSVSCFRIIGLIFLFCLQRYDKEMTYAAIAKERWKFLTIFEEKKCFCGENIRFGCNARLQMSAAKAHESSTATQERFQVSSMAVRYFRHLYGFPIYQILKFSSKKEKRGLHPREKKRTRRKEVYR